MGPDSHNTSARPSLIPNAFENLDDEQSKIENSSNVSSYLDPDILKQLRRELNEEVIDNEFNYKVNCELTYYLQNHFCCLFRQLETYSFGGSYEKYREETEKRRVDQT